MPKEVHLHPRDVEVLRLLADRQVETLDSLHERFWGDCNRKSAYNRLRALANAGYLQHIKRLDPAASKTWSGSRPASEHLYTLGPKAPTALRIRGREAVALARRHRRGGIPAALIDHQLATNRVADSLGVRLMSEHDAAVGLAKRHEKHRPDGAYRALSDDKGRDLVLVEVDLGHYSQKRIVQKAFASLDHEQARAMVFVCPTEERAHQVRTWVWWTVGPDLLQRFPVCTFEELRVPFDARPRAPSCPRTRRRGRSLRLVARRHGAARMSLVPQDEPLDRRRALTRTDVMSTADVALLLDVPKSTIEEWARRGMVPSHKRGRRRFYLSFEITDWLTSEDH